jgi:hypothetical protein
LDRVAFDQAAINYPIEQFVEGIIALGDIQVGERGVPQFNPPLPPMREAVG